MGRAKRTREAKYETPPGAATADGAPTAEGGGATRNVRGPASWSLRQSESLGAFGQVPVEVLNQIYDCLDARGLGLLECASVGLEREARAAAAQRARALYPDAAAAAALGLVPEAIGARYLVGRALPWTAPEPPAKGAPGVLPPAVARLGPVAFASRFGEGRSHYAAPLYPAYKRATAALLTAEAEDDTIFFMSVLRRRAGDRERTPVVHQAVPACLMSSNEYQACGTAIARRPTFEVLRQVMEHDSRTETLSNPFKNDWSDPTQEEIDAWLAFDEQRWLANRASVERLLGDDEFSITIHAARISDSRFACVLDQALSMESEDTESGLDDDFGIEPLMGEGTVSLVHDAWGAGTDLLQGSATHGLKVRGGVALAVVRDVPVGGGDIVQSTVRMDKVVLSLTPLTRNEPDEEFFGEGRLATSFRSHRHGQGVAVLRANDPCWFPLLPETERAEATVIEAAPKRPKLTYSAYLFFYMQMRSDKRQAQGYIDDDFNAESRRIWAGLSSVEKAPYNKLAADDVARHEREMAEFHEQLRLLFENT